MKQTGEVEKFVCSCNRCGAELNVPESKYGENGKCPACGKTTLLIPDSTEEEDPEIERRSSVSEVLYMLFAILQFVAALVFLDMGKGGVMNLQGTLIAVALIISGHLCLVARLLTLIRGDLRNQ